VLFMNATAFLASFESLSRAGTFQIVGWPRLQFETLNDFIFDPHLNKLVP
jgi:hypothetical protein